MTADKNTRNHVRDNVNCLNEEIADIVTAVKSGYKAGYIRCTHCCNFQKRFQYNISGIQKTFGNHRNDKAKEIRSNIDGSGKCNAYRHQASGNCGQHRSSNQVLVSFLIHKRVNRTHLLSKTKKARPNTSSKPFEPKLIDRQPSSALTCEPSSLATLIRPGTAAAMTTMMAVVISRFLYI